MDESEQGGAGVALAAVLRGGDHEVEFGSEVGGAWGGFCSCSAEEEGVDVAEHCFTVVVSFGRNVVFGVWYPSGYRFRLCFCGFSCFWQGTTDDKGQLVAVFAPGFLHLVLLRDGQGFRCCCFLDDLFLNKDDMGDINHQLNILTLLRCEPQLRVYSTGSCIHW